MSGESLRVHNCPSHDAKLNYLYAHMEKGIKIENLNKGVPRLLVIIR